MRRSRLAIALSVALTLPLSVPAQGVAASVPSETEIQQAVDNGTLQQLLSETLGATPDAQQVDAVSTLLQSLSNSKTSAALAAKTAASLVDIAESIAETDPQAALLLGSAAVETLNNPAVIEASPEEVGQSLIQLASVTSKASRAVPPGSPAAAMATAIMQQVDTLATNPTLAAATPGLGDAILEAEANIATAAGPGADNQQGQGLGQNNPFAQLNPPDPVAAQLAQQNQAAAADNPGPASPVQR